MFLVRIFYRKKKKKEEETLIEFRSAIIKKIKFDKLKNVHFC